MSINKRAIKFGLIRYIALPFVMLAFKILAKTYRITVQQPELVEEILSNDKALLLTAHGINLSLLGIIGPLVGDRRTVCVMTSPSRDGLLLDDVVTRMGIDVVKGSSRSQGAQGARGLVRAVEENKIAIVAIDGPRGPRFKAKPGFYTIASSSGADMYLMTTTANRYFHFKKAWDRTFLPKPFARITLHLEKYRDNIDEKAERDIQLEQVGQRLYDIANDLKSPIALDCDGPEQTRERKK